MMGSTSNYVGCDIGIMSKAQAKKILYSNNLINPVSTLDIGGDLIFKYSSTRINTVNTKQGQDVKVYKKKAWVVVWQF